MHDEALWKRLAEHALRLTDGPRDMAEALRDMSLVPEAAVPTVLQEYRRALYLAATADGWIVTSPLIDLIWARHMENPQAYVADLSDRVVGRTLARPPTRRGSADEAGYQRTLALYREEFGEEPPPNVWPGQAQRRFVVLGFGVAIGGALAGQLLGLAVGSEDLGIPVAFAAFGLGVYMIRRWGGWGMVWPE